jgi:hypothetical protein
MAEGGLTMFDRLAASRPLPLDVRPAHGRRHVISAAISGRCGASRPATLATASPAAVVASVGRWMAWRAERRAGRHNECVLEGRQS